jgi:hypothetical protein
MARTSENGVDQWLWSLLGNGWLTLIDAQRSAKEGAEIIKKKSAAGASARTTTINGGMGKQSLE